MANHRAPGHPRNNKAKDAGDAELSMWPKSTARFHARSLSQEVAQTLEQVVTKEHADTHSSYFGYVGDRDFWLAQAKIAKGRHSSEDDTDQPSFAGRSSLRTESWHSVDVEFTTRYEDATPATHEESDVQYSVKLQQGRLKINNVDLPWDSTDDLNNKCIWLWFESFRQLFDAWPVRSESPKHRQELLGRAATALSVGGHRFVYAPAWVPAEPPKVICIEITSLWKSSGPGRPLVGLLGKKQASVDQPARQGSANPATRIPGPAKDKPLARRYRKSKTIKTDVEVTDAASDQHDSEDSQYGLASETDVDEQQIEQPTSDHDDSGNSQHDTASETDSDEQQIKQPEPDRRIECMQWFEDAHDFFAFISERFQTKRPRDAALEDRLKGAKLEVFEAHRRAMKTHGRFRFGGKVAPNSYYVLTEDSFIGDRLVLLDVSWLSDKVNQFMDEAYNSD